MKLPFLKTDFWELRSAVKSHRKNPEKFWIPSVDQRNTLKVGQAAKLIFEIESVDIDGKTDIQGERMWVIVSEKIGDFYIGILDNRTWFD